MKKFKKVLSFVAAFTMAMAVPFTSMADITVLVEKPADWSTVYVHCFDAKKDGKNLTEAFNPECMSSWPGFEMTKDGDLYKYVVPCDEMKVVLTAGENGPQTSDSDVLKTGTYTFKNPKAGKITKMGEECDGVVFEMVSDGAAATTTEKKNDSTPKTADLAPIGIVAVIGLASVVVVLATRKKAVA